MTAVCVWGGEVSSGHEIHEGITDLDGKSVELTKAIIGWQSVDVTYDNSWRPSLRKHGLTTRHGQENTGEIIVVPSTHEPWGCSFNTTNG